MNIFHKVALQGLKKNRTRTLVTIIGVSLSAALITAVVTFGLSLLDYAAAGAAQKYGDWHVAFLDVDAAFTEARAADPAVADTFTMENIGYAALPGGQNPNKPYLYLTSFNQKTFDALPLTLLSGRMPENSSEVLIPNHVLSNGGVEFAPGDVLPLSLGMRTDGDRTLGQTDAYLAGETLRAEKKKTYTVVGTYGRPRFEAYEAPGYTVITKTDSKTESVSRSLFVTLSHPRTAYSYAETAAAGHAYITNDEVLRFMGLMHHSPDKIFSVLLYSIAGIVIAIIMVGSIFLIYNAFSISLNERTQQIGILSSVGATAKQLRNSVLFEGLCIGAIGIPIGVCLGIGGIGIVISIVAQNFSSIMYSGVPLTLHVSVPAILGAAAISLATILISAYVPARRTFRMSIMDCIRQTNEVKIEARAVKTPHWAQRIYGLEGILALKNFKRNKKRYRSIVLSLVLSVVLFISTSAFVTDLQQATTQAIAFTTYDIGFSANAMDDHALLALYDKLKTAQGVTESSYQADLSYFCTVPADALTDRYWESVGTSPMSGTAELPMEIQFLDDSTYLEILHRVGLPAAEYTGENAKLLAVAKLQTSTGVVKGERAVSSFSDLFQSTSVQTTMTPAANGVPDSRYAQAVHITCVDTVPPDIPPTNVTSAYTKQQAYYFTAVAPWSRMEQFIPAGAAPDLRVKGMTFSSAHPTQTAAAMETIIQEAGLTCAYTLLNTVKLLEENRNYIFIANVFAYTFILMISLIAVANVFNTISTNIRLRRRELAMLRSVGMSDRNFNKMMRFECALYGMRTLLFGLPIAIAASWLIYKGMSYGGGDEIVFQLPWVSIGISVLGVFCIVFVTMLYATDKIKKENIIDALRDDMT